MATGKTILDDSDVLLHVCALGWGQSICFKGVKFKTSQQSSQFAVIQAREHEQAYKNIIISEYCQVANALIEYVEFFHIHHSSDSTCVLGLRDLQPGQKVFPAVPNVI